LPPSNAAAPLYRALALSYRLGGQEEAWRVANDRINEATDLVERLDYIARRLEVPLPRRLRELAERVEEAVAGGDVAAAITAASELVEWVRSVGPRVEYLWVASGSFRLTVALANIAFWLYIALFSDVTGPQAVLAAAALTGLAASTAAGLLSHFHSSIYPLALLLVVDTFFAGLYIRSDYYLQEAIAALALSVLTAAALIHSGVTRGAAAKILGPP